jgi:uncharacterized protein YutE (UPF0331/DUF86 family)
LTDPDLLAQKLAVIETCVQELHTLARPAEIVRDVRETRFVLHTLQIAIQAALDVASHIVSDERMGEPETNRELFDRLASTIGCRPTWRQPWGEWPGSETSSFTAMAP